MLTILRRSVYFCYYLYRLDWKTRRKFGGLVKAQTGASNLQQWCDIMRDSLRFNISILEYYQFRFFELKPEEKQKWAGTGTMYEFQRSANPPNKRHILHNKLNFYEAYKPLFVHKLSTVADIQATPGILDDLLSSDSRLVLKPAFGNCGEGVVFFDTTGLSRSEILRRIESEGRDLVESFVRQHSILQSLSPSAVNTVRVFTQLRNECEVEILGCRLRISINSPVDNLAAGNIAAPIDQDSGKVCGPGVYSDMTRLPETTHPVTSVQIVGLQLPFWREVLDLVQRAAQLRPENRSVGWDIVITETGPGLIEGNHDWCKLVWQLPVQKGLKHRLDWNQ